MRAPIHSSSNTETASIFASPPARCRYLRRFQCIGLSIDLRSRSCVAAHIANAPIPTSANRVFLNELSITTLALPAISFWARKNVPIRRRPSSIRGLRSLPPLTDSLQDRRSAYLSIGLPIGSSITLAFHWRGSSRGLPPCHRRRHDTDRSTAIRFASGKRRSYNGQGFRCCIAEKHRVCTPPVVPRCHARSERTQQSVR
jgi:hypothetical protein